MSGLISISHVTRYVYDSPVEFGPHRLLIRPRDGHDLRVLEANLAITPSAWVHWQFDTFGNSVAHAYFSELSVELEIRSSLLIKRYARGNLIDPSERARQLVPPAYSANNRIDLAPYLALENPGEWDGLEQWLSSALPSPPGDVYGYLLALSAAIHQAFTYSRREELGTQSALTTIIRRTGTCRDFAFLFMECARVAGFAARFVTGYLNTREDEDGYRGGGSTHAWADIYVPGEGWLEFDPTNLIDSSQELIRIAVTRTPLQATPISGTFNTVNGKFLSMSVDVSVREVDENGVYDPN